LKDVLDALAYASEKWSVFLPGNTGGQPRAGWNRVQSQVAEYRRRRGLPT